MAKFVGKCGHPVARAEAAQCRACWTARGRGADSAGPDAIDKKQTESVAVSGDECEITKTTDERVRTLADLIRVCQIDTEEWDVERWIANKWEVGAKDASKELRIKPLFQVKAWLRRKVVIVAARAELDLLLADAKRLFAKAPAIVRPSILRPSEVMLEPHIPDLHVGKLAWGKETGDADYDARIAQKVYQDAVEALLARSAGHKIGTVLFPVGNDLLHSDTKQGTTTGGTPMDTDSRYQNNFTVARRLTQWAIERFRGEGRKVIVKLIPGNHDTLSVWHLGDSLQAFYDGRAKDVTIDNAPTMRKYHQHGKVMLLFTHGNRGKLEKYPLLMATEEPAMFGSTVYREAHTGDKHTTKVHEFNGVRVRISPALCPPDAWHSEMTFVGNQRGAEAFVWHREEGIVGTAVYTVPQPSKDGRAA
jgi:hypothetical protein